VRALGLSVHAFGRDQKVFVVFRRKLSAASQREPSCSECYKKVLQMVEELEARLEEYEYEEILKRWN
jgi:hypothetical protein